MLDLLRLGLEAVVFISAVFLGTSLLFGLFIAFFQAATQIQEQSLSFVVKISSMLIVLYFFHTRGADTILMIAEECFLFIEKT